MWQTRPWLLMSEIEIKGRGLTIVKETEDCRIIWENEQNCVHTVSCKSSWPHLMWQTKRRLLMMKIKFSVPKNPLSPKLRMWFVKKVGLLSILWYGTFNIIAHQCTYKFFWVRLMHIKVHQSNQNAATLNFSLMPPKLLKTLPNEAISSLITRNALIYVIDFFNNRW